MRGRQPAFVPLPASEEPVVLPTSERQATAANVAVVEGEATPGRTTGDGGALTPQPPRSPPPAVLAQVDALQWVHPERAEGYVHVLTVGETTVPRCKRNKSGKAQHLKGDVVLCPSVLTAVQAGRPFCKQCLRTLPPAQLEAMETAQSGTYLARAIQEYKRDRR